MDSFPTGDRKMDPADIDRNLQILANGSIELSGQFVYGSNYTYLVDLEWQDCYLQGVYKPSRGERPLWDFPGGSLAAREVAAFEVSRALGWNFVPPTVLRENGPAGPGSLQQYMQLVDDLHYFTLSAVQRQQLRPVALFDALINNADRKGGHVRLSPAGDLWLIDHGICFHHEDKLRTVIWDFAGEAIPDDLLQRLRGFVNELRTGNLADRLGKLLSAHEVEALQDRALRLIEAGAFPEPGQGRPYPWPLV